MDVQMPELDGLDATRRICERWPAESRPHIVAMTANALPEDREACFAAGMDDYVAKPIRAEELVAALKRAKPLRGRRTAAPGRSSMSASTTTALEQPARPRRRRVPRRGDRRVPRGRARAGRDPPPLARRAEHRGAAAGGAHAEVERRDARRRRSSRSSAARSSSARRPASSKEPSELVGPDRAGVRPLEDALAALRSEPARERSRSGAGTILIADDNRVNRLLLARGLEQEGHTVAFAEHGARRSTCCGSSGSTCCCSTSSCPSSTATRCWRS